MTKPKEHHPGQVAEICRRTSQRAFFWRPGADTRELFGYMLGKYAEDYGQLMHAGSLMSNHTHLLVTDETGQRSDFMQQLFSNTSRKRNLQLNRRENLWSTHPPGDMAVLDLKKIVERVLYVVLQPVAAGCVEKVEDWTGFQILPRHWGQEMRFERPELCGPTMPEVVAFTPMPPPGFERFSVGVVIGFFEALIAREEEKYAAARSGAVQGIDVCEAMSPFHRPTTEAPMRQLNPRFCTSDEGILVEALRRQRQFQGAHRAARLQTISGESEPIFPAGTLQMVRLAGVKQRPCAANHPMSTRTVWTPHVQAVWEEWSRAG